MNTKTEGSNGIADQTPTTLPTQQQRSTNARQGHGKHSEGGSVLGHTADLRKLRRIEMAQRMFPEHNGVKLEIDNRKKIRKPTHTQKLNKTLINNQSVKGETQGEVIKYLEMNENETERAEDTVRGWNAP